MKIPKYVQEMALQGKIRNLTGEEQARYVAKGASVAVMGYGFRIYPYRRRKYSFASGQMRDIERLVVWARKQGAYAKILHIMEGNASAKHRAYVDLVLTDPVALALEQSNTRTNCIRF